MAVSVAEVVAEPGISIAYDSRTNVLAIEKSSRTELHVELWDVRGRILMARTLTTQISSVPLQSYASGIYFVVVKNATNHTSRLIVKY